MYIHVLHYVEPKAPAQREPFHCVLALILGGKWRVREVGYIAADHLVNLMMKQASWMNGRMKWIFRPNELFSSYIRLEIV